MTFKNVNAQKLTHALVIFFVTIVIESAQSSQLFKLGEVSDSSSRLQIQQRLNDIEKLIPLSLQSNFSKPIFVSFINIPVHGVQFDDQIAISSSLLKNFETQTSTDSLLNRTIIHEFGHLIDRKIKNFAGLSIASPNCEFESPSNLDMHVSSSCLIWSDYKGTLSSTPDYLLRAGWMPTVNSRKLTDLKNVFSIRTLYFKEVTTPNEHFALNFEAFLTDPLYSCRRPTLYNFFSRVFDFLPFPKSSCKILTAYTSQSSIRDSKNPFLTIDFSRVYRIDYLFAGRGEDTMSRWGHAMLRLVICSPDRQKKSDECYKDFDQHLVISFQAFPDELTVSSLKGVTGKYPLNLYISSLSNVLAGYNRVELRDIESLPLNFSEPEIQAVLNRIVEFHWMYSSKYYFFSNNCAVETLNLIRSAVFREDLLDRTPQSPLDLKEYFQQNLGLVEYQNLTKKQMIEQGRYFTSYLEDYEKSLQKLGLTIRPRDYVRLSFEQRMDLLNRANTKKSESVVAAKIILEDFAYRTKKKLLLETILEEALAGNKSNLNAFTAEYQQLMQQSRTPGLLVAYRLGAYGLPTQDEIDFSVQEIQKSFEDLNSSQNKIKNEYKFSKVLTDDPELSKTFKSLKILYNEL